MRDVLALFDKGSGRFRRVGRVFEIGGDDVVTYRQMMDLYAPVLSPGLLSLWVGLVTPIPADLARPLIDSLVVSDHAIDEVVARQPIGCREAIELALRRVGALDVSARWTDAELYGRTPADPIPTDPDWAGATIFGDRQVVHTNATPEALFGEVCGLMAAGAGSSARGCGPRAVGWIAWWSVGMRRGRRHPIDLRAATSSTSGASKRSSMGVCCGFAPRCVCPAMPGSSGRSHPNPTASCLFSYRVRPRAYSVGSIDTRSHRFIGSFSGGWPLESRRMPRRR